MVNKLTGLVFVVQVLFIGLLCIMLNSQQESSQRHSKTTLGRELSIMNSGINVRSLMTSNSTVIPTDAEASYDDRDNDTIVETYEEESVSPTINFSYKRTTFLLIMVSIQSEEFSARQCIRNTWYRGFSDSEDVMMKFVIGTKGVTNSTLKRLQNEINNFKDITFLEHIEDNSFTTTNKTLSMFVWAHENVNFTYMMKTEEFTFVYVNNMIDELRKRPEHTGLYYGKVQFKRRPIRKGSQWADPDWDLAKYYLPFALGGGYILSADLIGLLVQRNEYLAYHPNEDTAVASWIAAYRYERRSDKLICITQLNKNNVLEGKCESRIIARFCYGLTGADLQKWFTILYEATINS